jgi:hypothetical protein
MNKIRKAYVDPTNDQIHYLYSNGQGIPLLLFHRTPASSVIYEKAIKVCLDRLSKGSEFDHW